MVTYVTKHIDALTTPKYRFLCILYLLFVILDNFVFLSIIFTFILHVTPQKFEDLLLNSNWKLVLVIFIEVFYDILQAMVKIWLVNRVSFYFVLCLYGAYYLVFNYLNLWETSLTVLFCLRFASFLLETIIDLCIDLELDHDLANGSKIHALPSYFCCLKNWNAVAIRMPQGWRYKGSVCVWVPVDVMECDSDEFVTTDGICCKCCKNCRWFHYILWLFAVPIAVPIIMFASLLACVVSLFGRFYVVICKCRRNGYRPNTECCWGMIDTPTLWREFARRDV